MTNYTHETLLAAFKAGQRSFVGVDLSGANLYGANLYGASLSGANLYGANLREAYSIGCLGLYSVRPPFMSSRNDALYAGVFERDGGLVLLFSAGCQRQQTAAELREKVRETHGMNAHAVQYEAAITFIEACFASDMTEGRFAVKEVQS